MRKQYIVDLTPDERTQLMALTRKGKASARQVTRAHALHHAADGLKDLEIAAAAHTSVPTVACICKRFVQRRVQEALTERYRPGGRTHPSLLSLPGHRRSWHHPQEIGDAECSRHVRACDSR